MARVAAQRHVLVAIGPDAAKRFPQATRLAADAVEMPFDGDLATLRARHPDLDINLVPAANRRKKLLIADMESTIISCECLDELADIVGAKAQIADITARAMRGEIAFEGALKARVAMLKGLPLTALDQVLKERVRFNPGAQALVATMARRGARTRLVSGGFTVFTGPVAKSAGFHHHQANTLLHDGTALTGEVGEPILGREAKLAALEEAVTELGITSDDVLAVGDGANDLAMIERAGLGVAYHAKPIVADAAAARIDHAGLTALLYLQGYREDEIVQPSPSSFSAT